jgi:hypothetical protein
VGGAAFRLAGRPRHGQVGQSPTGAASSPGSGEPPVFVHGHGDGGRGRFDNPFRPSSTTTIDFTGRSTAAGRTMTGSWAGSRGRSGTPGRPPWRARPHDRQQRPASAPKPGVAVNIRDGRARPSSGSPARRTSPRFAVAPRSGSAPSSTTSTKHGRPDERRGKSNFTKGSFLVKERAGLRRAPDRPRTRPAATTRSVPSRPKRRMPSAGPADPSVVGQGKGKVPDDGQVRRRRDRPAGPSGGSSTAATETLTKVLSGSVTVRDFKRKADGRGHAAQYPPA